MSITDLLLQRTPDGATYLQAIIMLWLLCLVIYLIICGICEDIKGRTSDRDDAT